MANEKTAPKAVAAPGDFPLTLDEFCTRLSQSDRRVELIGGFHAHERAAGHTKDVETAFAARFVSFVNQPA